MDSNKNLEDKGKYYPMVVLSMKKLLLDDTFSDLVIKIGNESVFAHAGIVCIRCKEILGLPLDDKKKQSKKKLEVKIKDGVASAAIMSKVLEYLYTGIVDFTKMSDKEILHLVGASRYFKLHRLNYLCETWLREHMTIESVFHLLKAATDLNEERVKNFCLSFALAHYNEFISNKDGIYILGIELFQEVVAAFQTNPTPPKEMRPEDTPDTLLEDFQRLYDQMPYSDITFQIRGESIKAHRAILASHSDAFVSTIFKDDTTIRLTPTAFKNMLRFTYYGDDRIDALPSCELVEFTRKYKLPSLLKICEDKIRTSIAFDTVLPILSIAYLPADGKQDLVDELKSKCFPFILENLASVDLKTIKACNPLMVVDFLLEIQLAWKSGKYGLGKLPAGFNALSGSAGGSKSSSSRSRDNAPPSSSVQQGATGFNAGSRISTSFEDGGSRPSRKGPSTGLLGAQRRGPAPPPSRGRGRGAGFGAGAGAPRPTPAARNSSDELASSSEETNSAPKPPTRAQPPPPVKARPPRDSSDGSEEMKKSKGDDKRKKEEAKRVQKEKKERAKMEKKFKPKGKEIY